MNFRHKNREKFPGFHNAPVDSFGSIDAALLIVGLAPGLKGANRTARPFTGDYAGDLLYPTILEFGFASGNYGATPDDGLELKNCRITNAVRCVPPENKPVGAEMNACRSFLIDEIVAMKKLQVILGARLHRPQLGAANAWTQAKCLQVRSHGRAHTARGPVIDR